MRHTALMFSGPLKAKTEEEKVSYLLLWVGDKGRDIRHTWTDISTDDAKKLDTFYERYDVASDVGVNLCNVKSCLNTHVKQ